MVFKVNARPEFTRTVTILVPTGDSEIEETLEATYRVTPKGGHDVLTSDGMKAFLKEAIVRLDDVADESGERIASSPELIKGVLELDNARLALMRTYSSSVAKLKTGN